MVTRVLAACLTLGAAFGDPVAFAQSNDADITRFEEKMASQKLAREVKAEMRELAHEIYARADKRANEAFKNSPTGKAMSLELKNCRKLEDKLTKKLDEKISKENISNNQYNMSKAKIIILIRHCKENIYESETYIGKDQIISEIRSEFISEDINDLEINEVNKEEIKSVIENF